MRVFRFFPPSVEEQRAFFVQLAGTLFSLAVIGVLVWQSREAGLRGVLLGAGLGVLYLLVRAAWQLERKVARAQHGEISIREDGISHTNYKGETSFIPWENIAALEVVAGQLQLTWSNEKNRKCELRLSAREIEDGMELIQLIAARGRSTSAASTSTNFIPLEPK